MRVEKEKRKVTIICIDKSVITGFIHLSPGVRMLDFLNRENEKFIVITQASFQNIGEVHAFKLYNELTKKRDTVCLNKTTVKFIEEV